MAGINIKNVHRSNALQHFAYGRSFAYDERFVSGEGEAGRKAALESAAMLDTLRDIELPPAGTGPTPAERESGSYDLLFLGRHASGDLLRAVVTGDRDPGYGSTSKMLAETALCLVEDFGALPGGIWTPGAAMQGGLLQRLAKTAGLSFRIESA